MCGQSALTERVPGPSELAVGNQRKPPRRERLRHEHQRVTCHEELMTAAQLVRGPLPRVQRDCRLVAAAPARQPQAQRQIDVLEVREVALIEAIHLEHCRPAEQSRARTRAEYFARILPATVIAPGPAPLLAHPVAAEHVA